MAINDDIGLRELATQGFLAGVLGMIGRALAMATAKTRPTGWCLLWEVPIAIGMGVIGTGLADWLKLGGFVHFAVVIAVSYTGPRALDIVLARYAESKSLKP